MYRLSYKGGGWGAFLLEIQVRGQELCEGGGDFFSFLLLLLSCFTSHLVTPRFESFTDTKNHFDVPRKITSMSENYVFVLATVTPLASPISAALAHLYGAVPEATESLVLLSSFTSRQTDRQIDR